MISPSLIKNLISVHAFTCDNWVSVEFDPFGFSIKDLLTRMVLLRCDSTGELYPLSKTTTRSSNHHNFYVQHSGDLWHTCLGHPGHNQLHQVLRSFDFSCSKASYSWHACHLGKNVRLPFPDSNKVASFPFHLLHCDVWTSPVVSSLGYKFYLVILDDFTHFTWTFPLHHKSDVMATLISFHAFVLTQFNCPISCIQTDNGKELTTPHFDLSWLHTAWFFVSPASTHLNRMVTLRWPFAASTTACAPCCSTPVCLCPSGRVR
jgi:hypothetical protein